MAQWYASDGEDHWKACRLYYSLAHARGVEMQHKMLYMQACLSGLETHVPSTQPGATKMKATVMWRLYKLGTDKADKAAMLGRMLRWAQSKDNPPPPRITFGVGLVLCCHQPSQYAIHPTRANKLEGADMTLSCAEIT